MTNTAIPETAPMDAARLALGVAAKRLLAQRGGEIRFFRTIHGWPTERGAVSVAGIRLDGRGNILAFPPDGRGAWELKTRTLPLARLGELLDAAETA